MSQWMPGQPPREGEGFMMDQHGCARCDGEGHDLLNFDPFTRPVVIGEHRLTHWAICPTTNEPILIEITCAPR